MGNTHLYVNMYECVYTYMIFIYIHTHTHTHTRTHARTHKHIHTYISLSRALSLSRSRSLSLDGCLHELKQVQHTRGLILDRLSLYISGHIECLSLERHSSTVSIRPRGKRDIRGIIREVGGWGRVPFSRNFMKPTPRRKWYLTTGRRFH